MLDPTRQDDGARARPAGLAGRRLGQDRVLGRRGRGGWPAAARRVILVRDRDQPRGHSRHARRARAS